jgi:carbamoyl-phosphate synthase large subunit
VAKDRSIKKIMILGSGPIVIGQACEFDYSGTQACKALMREGFEVILVNSNPATIMTDPEIATRVYIEPLKAAYVEKIIEKERPDALIPTLGGQTALNLGLELNDTGVLTKYNVRMLGATPETIRKAEDREAFRDLLDHVGAKYPKSRLVRSFEDGVKAVEAIGFPAILRPNYTLGGGGGGTAYQLEEYKEMLLKALTESPTSEVLVEESILGWKEFELEVMRDSDGTFVIVCSIENFDPCGVHTGDSITVAPQQTLTDRQYQEMRDEARKIIDAVGLATGGANIQFAVHPTTGQRVVIEMNPRVSRSSALASKATGFPIAKIAALLAVGYKLHEIQNDITKTTPSCYEPALDYVVTKVPRFAFEKFAGSRDLLGTQMKSVGEVMGIGRTFQESLMKSLAALETSSESLPVVQRDDSKLVYPNSQRILHLAQAMRDGVSFETLYEQTQITPWFLEQLYDIINQEGRLAKLTLATVTNEQIREAKRYGFTDVALARLWKCKPADVAARRKELSVKPCFHRVDTCAGEFESTTPYFYSSYWGDRQPLTESADRVVVLGSGPNRIGQGIEFDYSCVRGVKAFQKEGLRVVMVNSNPETVSTDYDTADELFFEPLTLEHVSEVAEYTGSIGIVAQLGGQTPINLAQGLVNNGFKILGSSLEAIDLAEDRGRFANVVRDLGFAIPKSLMATNVSEALKASDDIGFPMICRPNYVLGGRRMEIVENQDELKSYFARHGAFVNDRNPCLIDQFLAGALEVDVDLVRGQDWVVIGGVLEHIEAAGVHSGDSMGVLPPQRLKDEVCNRIENLSIQLANRLGIVGHLNLQLAVKNDVIYVLEANPRSSRSVPFIAKATGVPLVDLAAKAMLGAKASQVQPQKYNWRNTPVISVKGVVFPFKKFSQADSILGPEMKSTGECMGRGTSYAEALMKACLASNIVLPKSGEVFLSLRDKDKTTLLPVVRELEGLGYKLSATRGTAKFLASHGVTVAAVNKVSEGRPHCVDRIRSRQVAFVINTTSGRQSIEESFEIRRSCTDYLIPCITESDAAEALVYALKLSRAQDFGVAPL